MVRWPRRSGATSQCIELADLARVFEQKLAQQRVLAEQANPFIGKLDQGALDRVQAADQGRAAGSGPYTEGN